jgi:hypothetical protein
MEPSICVRICRKVTILDHKNSTYFVCYSREFVITVIIITEFDCSLICTLDKDDVVFAHN